MRMLVLGAGISGLAAARLARRLGHRVTIYDARTEALEGAGSEGFSTAAGDWDPVVLDGVDLVITSPGLPERATPIVETLESGVPLVSEIEFAWRHLDVPVVAVTGTNGKTTVTSLVSEMLMAGGANAPALGNIGTALSDRVGTELDVAVVEVSSFQLRFVDTFRPAVAVVTNVAPDHLDWHGSFERYLDAKRAIVAAQKPQDLLVFDDGDEGARRIAERAPSRTVGIPEDGIGAAGYGIARSDGALVAGPVSVPFERIAVSDRAFLVDLLLAAGAALEMGARPEDVAAVWEGFSPAAHRRTEVCRVEAVAFVDDSKATNPHAALAAIRSYPSVVLIAGGLDKDLDVAPLATEPNVRAVVAIGTAAPGLLDAAGERGVPAGSMAEAVRLAAKLAVPGDVVLLAPGCASFDMFESYGHRGDEFAAAALELVAEEANR